MSRKKEISQIIDVISNNDNKKDIRENGFKNIVENVVRNQTYFKAPLTNTFNIDLEDLQLNINYE